MFTDTINFYYCSRISHSLQDFIFLSHQIFSFLKTSNATQTFCPCNIALLLLTFSSKLTVSFGLFPYSSTHSILNTFSVSTSGQANTAVPFSCPGMLPPYLRISTYAVSYTHLTLPTILLV